MNVPRNPRVKREEIYKKELKAGIAGRSASA